MRIAHVITRMIIGGAQENTLFNVDDQHHLFGDEVCLLTGHTHGPEGSLEQRAIARGLNVRSLSIRIVPKPESSDDWPLISWEFRRSIPFTERRFTSDRIRCCIMRISGPSEKPVDGAITSSRSATR